MTATTPTVAVPDAILAALDAIMAPGQVTEVRAFDATTHGDRWPKTLSGYFDAPAKLAAAVAGLRSAEGVYIIPNPVSPNLIARANNRLRAVKKGDATNEGHVLARRWLLIDIDADRESGISSTDAEHAIALATVERIAEDLGNEGWPTPIMADSGNGGHLMYRVDLPADDAADDLIGRTLAGLAQRYDSGPLDADPRFHVDQTVKNRSRLFKLYGTVAAKGDDCEQRPHRMSRLLSVPDTLDVVTAEQLEAIATPRAATATAAKPANGQANGQVTGKRRPSAGGKIDLGEWLSRFGLGGDGPTDWHSKLGPAKRWVLDKCVWNPDHTDGSMWAAQSDDGTLLAGCSHDSCRGKNWHDLRSIYDPKPDRKGDGKFGSAFQKTSRRSTADQPCPTDDELEGGGGGGGVDPDDVEQTLTEAHNARLLVERFGAGFRWHHERGMFLTYVAPDGRWAEDVTGQVSRHAKAIADATWSALADMDPADRKAAVVHATRSSTARGIAAMMTLAQSEPGVTVAAAQLDADPWLLNVANGVLDTRTGRLAPHTPGLLLTRYAPVAFDPAARCPTFDRFMDRIMAGQDELVGYLQRIAGLCITGDISVQELFVFWGSGANGKSVLCDTLGGMLGDYAGLAPPALLTMRSNDEHPTEIADLQGRRCVFGSETEEGARLRIQLVKRLTGDARLKGRYMRQDYFEFARQFKLVLATNNKPKITENTNAIWRRLRLVPFAVVIPPDEQDPLLIEKLRAEWPGILAWAVRGNLARLRDGMQPPAAVLDATAEYAAEQDVLADYLAARCVRGGDNVRVGRAELFADYQSWASQTGERHPLERNALFDRVRRLDGVAEGQWKPVGISVPVRGFRGIGLAAYRGDE